ncbi:MAG: hypothetical protein WCG14_06425 [Chlamydiia bacterium]
MNETCYEFREGSYQIIDPELAISYKDHETIIRLPEDLTPLLDTSKVSVHRFATGQIEKIYCLKEQVRHGEARHFYPEGNLLWKGFYKEGRLHGPSTYFGNKGELLSKAWFFQGCQEGIAYQYSRHGALLRLIRFKEGRPHGMQHSFYENGQKKSEMRYDRGLLEGDLFLFFEGGETKRSCHFTKGEKHGYDKIFNAAGILIDEGCYDQGVCIGVHRRHFPSGALAEEISYDIFAGTQRKKWDLEGSIVTGGSVGSI